MTSNDPRWRSLPLDDGRVRDLTIHGNGKDCCLRIRLLEPERDVTIELRDPKVELTIRGLVVVRTFNRGDGDLGLVHEPLEPLEVIRCEVLLTDDDEQWNDTLGRLRGGKREPLWEVPQGVRIELAPAG